MQHGMKDINDQCKAETKSGKRCTNWVARGNEDFCNIHQSKGEKTKLAHGR